MMRIDNAWRTLVWSVALIVLFTACSSNDESKVFVPTPKSVEINFGVAESVNYLELGDDPTYSVKGEVPEWLTITLEEFEGANRLKLVAAANGDDEDRVANFEIVTSKQVYQVSILQTSVSQRGLYILSEGNWKAKQSDIAYYDVTNDKLHTGYFSEVNGRNLGDVGNDIIIYGSKMYCLVSEQNPGTNDGLVEVIDPKTCKSIKQIPFVVDKEKGIQDIPRRFVFEDGKGYITGFGGFVARLDTVSLEIDAVAPLEGDNLKSEGITVYKNNLYIANSGYGEGTTVSVVDKRAMKELHKIEVPTNPVNILAVGDDIYLQTSMTSMPANLHILNPITEKVVHTFDVGASKLALNGDYLYTGTMNWSTFEDEIYQINAKTKEVTPFSIDPDDITSVYSFDVNSVTNELYIGSMGDDVVILNDKREVTKKLNVSIPFISRVVPVAW